MKNLKIVVFGTLAFILISGSRALAESAFQEPVLIFEGKNIHSDFQTLDVNSVSIGGVTIGSYYDRLSRISHSGYITSSYSLASVSGNVEVVDDGCSGTYNGSANCTFNIRATPVGMGPHSGSVVFNFSGTYQSGDEVLERERTFTWNVTFSGTIDPPQEFPCPKKGSIINEDEQTVGEIIPLVGSDFRLHYFSGYAPEYLGNYYGLVRKNSFNRESWTISVQHLYQYQQKKLFLGTGEVVRADFIPTSQGHLVVSPEGTEVYVFDQEGTHLQTLTALKGAVKYQFHYDANLRLINITDSYSRVTTFNRNTNGSLTSIVAPNGQVTTVSRNDNSALIRVTNPKGEAYEMTYKEELETRLLETFKKPGGQVTTFSYDPDGKLIKDQGNGGNAWSLEGILGGMGVRTSSQMGRTTTYENTYNGGLFVKRKEVSPSGLVTTYTEPNQNTTRVTSAIQTIQKNTVPDKRFGAALRVRSLLRQTIAGQASVSTYGQSVTNLNPDDPFDFTKLTRTTTTNGRKSSVVYDAGLGRWTFKSAAGKKTFMDLDQFERPLQIRNGKDTPVKFTYDSSGRLIKSNQGAVNKVTYQYDAVTGYLNSVTNQRSEKTSYTYDEAGRVISTKLPDGRKIIFTHDLNGNITSVKTPSKAKHSFIENAMGLLAKYVPPGLGAGVSKNTTYTYDLDKQLTRVNRPDGKSIVYNYDLGSGLLTQINSTGVGRYLYSYDAVTKMVNEVTSPYGVTDRYEYYGPYQSSEEQIRKSDNFSVGKVSYSFDVDHRVITRTTRGNSGAQTYNVPFTLNEDDLPIRVGDLNILYSYPSGRVAGTSLGGVSDELTYDIYGNLSGYRAIFTKGATTTELYSYVLTRDTMSRIVSKVETVQGVSTQYEYAYDKAGRLVGVKRNGVLVTSAIYDSNSNRISGETDGVSFSATYDSQDRMISYAGRNYTYNSNGDLLSINWDSTSSSIFDYDAFGNLKSAQLPSGSIIKYTVNGKHLRVRMHGTEISQKRYLYDPSGRIAAEVSNAGSLQKHYITVLGHSPDYMNSGGSNHRIIKDHLGSVRLVVNASNGKIVQRIDYGSYGKVTSDSNPGFQPFGFAGGLYDHHTQLVRFGARDYDPETGRWTSKDPILFAGGDTNLYGYVANDPVNWVDPDGLKKTFVFQNGNLSFYDDNGGLLFDGPAKSGPWGNGALPKGNYSVGGMRDNRSGSYACSGSGGYSLDLHPQFPTNRTDLRIHPDGGTPGTLGCIGVNCSNGAADALGEMLRGIYSQPMTPWIGLEVR